MKMLHALLRAVLVLACAAGAGAASVRAPAGSGGRHGFYRSMAKRAPAGSRRVFGGASAELSAFPPTCVLMDRYWATRCSGAVLTPHWVLTAAHCVTPQVAYIQYNTRRPSSHDSNTAAVMYMYRHPQFTVREEDEGRGLDVTALRNDVGMLRTNMPMQLSSRPAVQSPMDPVRSLHLYDLKYLTDSEVQVLGFGGTERSALGEELFEVRLRAVPCERGSWEHCMCGVGQPAAAGGARGVCAGDSGGPVVFRGAQVGVTSMGPIECSAAAEPPESATSVFTSLYQYSDLVNATMYDTEETLKMRRLSSAAGAPRSLPAPLAAALLVRALR
ncbi:hypothetical protein PYW07_014966 [Mythimna separata]|uniref:Peptidase S1 domain-containing protein n=1 Tax=Mythimna separata TaxID=271217 RepID=A0AAD7Z0R5_MYTSE|nr:hypothetical protein PYW07_014966 [Mythimna separata]